MIEFYQNLKNITPKSIEGEYRIPAPTIHEAEGIVPKVELSCGASLQFEDIYLIVGERVDPKEAGLAEKVGERQVLIRVPKELIDRKKKNKAKPQ